MLIGLLINIGFIRFILIYEALYLDQLIVFQDGGRFPRYH